MTTRPASTEEWQPVCRVAELEVERGATALVHGQALAIFRTPDDTVYALGNHDPFAKGSVIAGLDEAAKVDGVEIFYAGTRSDGDRILANGGRVLNVCAIGRNIAEAQKQAYAAVDMIRWPEGFCRRDIGWRAITK